VKLVLATAASILVLGDSTPSLAPRTVTWDEMSRDVFRSEWILPEGLPIEAKEGSGPAWDLAVKMPELARLVVPPSATDASAPRCLGDVVRDMRLARKEGRDADAVIARVKTAQPELWTAIEPCANEILHDDKLFSKKWDPDDDDARDGFCFARPLTIAKVGKAPWKDFDGSKLVHQAVQLIHADLEAIKAAENDFPAYKKRPKNTYEWIYPLEGSYVRGTDDKGHPFAALCMFFESDLPFPFSTYKCDLHILSRTDAHGDFVCDIYSPHEDWLWMAGRDVFVPLRSSDGAWQATVMVRWFGFDMKGVPDGDDDRRAALRSGAGALKRDAEALFAAYGGPPRTIEGRTPAFEVLGKK
jgi:hypothetical protein